MSTSLQHSPARPTLVPPPSDAQVEATVRRATQFLFEFVDRYVEGSSSGVVMKTAEAALVAGSLAEISTRRELGYVDNDWLPTEDTP